MNSSSDGIPREWIEAETGYRVIRLSDVPGSSSLYFNYSGYTPQGDLLVISTPTGLSKVNLKSPSLDLTEIIKIKEPFKFLFTGRKTRTAYYEQDYEDDEKEVEGGKSEKGVLKGVSSAVYAVDIDTGVLRKVVDVAGGTIQSINADETLLGGVDADRSFRPDVQRPFARVDKRYDQANYQATHSDGRPMTYHEAKGYHMIRRFEARVPMKLFVIDTTTGKRRDVYEARDWLNHLLFSPTDPNLLLFCHEGPWHRLDRLWLIRIDQKLGDAKPTCIHNRTMNMEISGHEWWSHDGRIVWYDLQRPKGEDFFVAGYEVDTGRRTWYHLERDQWSVHFHSSYDGQTFAGDGAAENMVGRSKNAKWLYLFRPKPVIDDADGDRVYDESLIDGASFAWERLVDMGKQDYRLEPNVNFSPDGKFLVFRANLHGGVQTYAVDLARGGKA